MCLFLRNAPAHYNIPVVHYKKWVHNKNLWCITKKRVPVTSACSPKPETRTIANSGLRRNWVSHEVTSFNWASAKPIVLTQHYSKIVQKKTSQAA